VPVEDNFTGIQDIDGNKIIGNLLRYSWSNDTNYYSMKLNEKEKIKKYQEKYTDFNTLYKIYYIFKVLQIDKNTITDFNHFTEVIDTLEKNCVVEKHTSNKNIDRMYKEIYDIDTNNRRITNSKIDTAINLIKKCSHGECKGFVDKTFSCGLCSTKYCKKCHEELGENEHVCDADTLLTIGAMVKDSKPCPNCAVRIHKILGCHEMFCTQCATSFDWKSLKIITGAHNPHLFDWISKQTTVAPHADYRQCGRVINRQNITYFISVFQKILTKSVAEKYSGILRNFSHFSDYTARQFLIGDQEDENELLRIKFMCNYITEDEFKVKLQRLSKKNEKYTQITQALELFKEVVSDSFYIFAEKLEKMTGPQPIKIKMHIDNFEKQTSDITVFVNGVLSKISSKYNCKKYFIRKDFILQ
jgi:hypothetical protein